MRKFLEMFWTRGINYIKTSKEVVHIDKVKLSLDTSIRGYMLSGGKPGIKIRQCFRIEALSKEYSVTINIPMTRIKEEYYYIDGINNFIETMKEVNCVSGLDGSDGSDTFLKLPLEEREKLAKEAFADFRKRTME